MRRVVLFRPNFDKYSIVDLFHLLHPDLAQYRSDRWARSIAAIKAGTYFERPDYQPVVAQHLTYHEPMWGLLQSKNEHVEKELNTMRTHPSHIHSRFMLVGGDGLAINRINWTLARNPAKYLLTSPAIIPVQGEHPHGTCHVLHMGWRPYAPLALPIMTSIGHRELKADFTVSDFNDYDFAMCILIEGITQYFIVLEASGGPPLASGLAFLTVCNLNIDLAWLSHFIYDFGFMYWDLRQSVRSNNSARIDLIWREAVSFMHIDESHKTQYAPMAIMRIFWSEALSPVLSTIYHRHRTISLLGIPGSNVGWDMPIEKENLACEGLIRPSEERLKKFIEELNFLGPVSRGLERLMKGRRKQTVHRMKKIDRDVQAVVEHLKATLGATWAQASVPRVQANSLLVNPPKSRRPWLSRDAMIAEQGGRAFRDWIRSHLDSKVTWM